MRVLGQKAQNASPAVNRLRKTLGCSVLPHRVYLLAATNYTQRPFRRFFAYNLPHRCFAEGRTSPSRTRTYNLAVNSRSLYQLSYRGIITPSRIMQDATQYNPSAQKVKHLTSTGSAGIFAGLRRGLPRHNECLNTRLGEPTDTGSPANRQNE